MLFDGILHRNKRIKEKSRLYFDLLVEMEEKIQEPQQCYREILNRLSGTENEDDTGKKLLDVGCGTGEMLRMIEDARPGKYHLFGIDISANSLSKAAASLGSAAVFAEGDAEALPYADGQFDIVLCMHSFHHYPDPDRALCEMKRVLRPGGVLYLVENEYTDRVRRGINLSLFLRGYPNGDIRMYSRKRLTGLLERAGFTDLHGEHIADHSQLLICRK